jgi:hypothetical protein
LGKSYGLSAMPLTVLDRNGKIASAHAGLINRRATEKEYPETPAGVREGRMK